MNNIGIISLSVRNFKGIKKFDHSFAGKDTSIFGTNATGKTSLFDSISWLLFDKDSLNSGQFEIKPLDENGKVRNSGAETEVSAAFSGETAIELKKVYYEKWVKRRGQADREFSGNTTDYFVDGVPVKKKEYDARVADICRPDLFLLLTNPRHFNTIMKWEDRRAMLLDVCGDITTEDVIASNKDLEPLPAIIGKHTIDDYKKIAKSSMTAINKQIEDIPVRISETERSITDLRSEKTVQGVISHAEDKKAGLEEKLSQIINGGEIAAKVKEVAEIETKIINLDNKAAGELSKLKKAYQDEKEKLEQSVFVAGVKLGRAIKEENEHEQERSGQQDIISKYEEQIEQLRQEWYVENDRIFDNDLALEKDTCPTCGQSLPEEQVEAARIKALESFNAVKAQLLREIDNKGKAIKDTISKATVRRDAAIEKLAAMAEKIEALEKESESARKALESFKPFEGYNPDNQERTALVDKADSLRQEIKALKEGAKGSIDEVETELAAVKEEIKALNKELADIENADKAKARIADLKKEERKLAGEYEKLEGHLNLIETFIRAKVSLLDSKINAKFSVVSFKLFKEQINGGLAECCIATKDGVPYDSMNNGARINAGLDIINVMAAHYGIAMPVFIDNAESITDLLPTIAQQVRLVVSPEDQTLRIEGE